MRGCEHTGSPQRDSQYVPSGALCRGLLGDVGSHEEAPLAWQGLLHNHGRHVHSVLVCEVENVCRGQ